MWWKQKQALNVAKYRSKKVVFDARVRDEFSKRVKEWEKDGLQLNLTDIDSSVLNLFVKNVNDKKFSDVHTLIC